MPFSQRGRYVVQWRGCSITSANATTPLYKDHHLRPRVVRLPELTEVDGQSTGGGRTIPLLNSRECPHDISWAQDRSPHERPAASSARGTTEIEYPSVVEMTVMLLAQRSQSQKYWRLALTCPGCVREARESAGCSVLPPPTRNSFPPRKYRKSVSQDEFAHFVTMDRARRHASDAPQSCQRCSLVDSHSSTRYRIVYSKSLTTPFRRVVSAGLSLLWRVKRCTFQHSPDCKRKVRQHPRLNHVCVCACFHCSLLKRTIDNSCQNDDLGLCFCIF